MFSSPAEKHRNGELSFLSACFTVKHVVFSETSYHVLPPRPPISRRETVVAQRPMHPQMTQFAAQSHLAQLCLGLAAAGTIWGVPKSWGIPKWMVYNGKP